MPAPANCRRPPGPSPLGTRLALAIALVAMVLTTATSPPARATGLLVARFGGEWGHPMSDDLWSIYYNPAGLSLLGGTKLALSGSFAWRAMSYTRGEAALDDVLEDPDVGAGTPQGAGISANTGEATLSNFLVTPFFAVGSDFGIDGFGAALGFYVPIGGQSIWDRKASSPEFPGAEDGAQRWWTIEGTIRSMYATAAAGYRIAPLRLSVGAGLNVVISEIDNIQARNVDGTDNLVANGRLQEGRARIDVSSVDLAVSLGLLWEPIDHLFIGLSYQSQPGFGEQRLTGDVDLVLGSGPVPESTRTAAEVRQSMPDVLRFGVRYGAPKSWEVRLFGDWARWSVLTEQCILNATVADRSCVGDAPPGKIIIIPRHWKDAWGVRGGGSWWATPDLELVLGGGWDGNAVPDAMVEPALYDGDKFHLTLGAKLTVGDALEVMLSYSQIIYPDRDIAARGRVPKDPNDPTGATWTDIATIGLRDAVRVPDAAGQYTHAVGVVELGMSYRF
jgi:long-chain fatty acid transport protein